MENKKERAACNKIPFIEAGEVPMIFHLPFKKVSQLASTGNKDWMALELFC